MVWTCGETVARPVDSPPHPNAPSGSRTIEFIVNDGDVDSAPATKDIEINDAPTLDTTDTALSYRTSDGPVPVDSGITASDPDSAQLQGATVQISSNFVAAEDELAFDAQSGIGGSYDDTTGTLTLTGTASVADYQAALQSVTYENSSATPSTATRTVSFQATDTDGAASNVATRDIQIDASPNDAPVVTTSAGPTAYAEGDPATAVDPGLTVSDPDDANLERATVRISSGLEEGDVLAFDDQAGIIGTYNAESGVLTLTGSASVADYQTALRSIGYFNTGNLSEASKTVEFKVSDGAADSNAATKTIAVVEPPPPPNVAPVVETSEGSTTYTEGDPPTAVDPALTVSDLDDANIESATVRLSSGLEDGDALTFEDQAGIFGIYNGESGVLTLTGSASVADYQTALRSIGYFNSGNPSAEFKTVEFKVNDGDADSNAATKTIAVVGGQPPDNQAPNVTTSEGSTTYTLGDETGVVVDDALTVTDADDTNLESGRVQIEGFEPGDELVFVDQAGISGSFDTSTGGLNLVGTASVANYQTALRSIRFRHFGDNQSAFRSVAFRVNDGELDSRFALKTIDITTP